MAIKAEIESWWNGLDDETRLEWCDAYLHGIWDSLAATLPKANREVGPDTWIWDSARGWIMTRPMREVVSTVGHELVESRKQYWTGELVQLADQYTRTQER